MEAEKDIFGEMEVLASRLRFEPPSALAASLEGLADLQRERAGRMEAARGRLARDVAEDDPHLRAITRRGAAAGRMAEEASTLARRWSRRATPGTDQWLVAGRVLTATGEPAANLRVRVFDRDRKLDDLLGETLTDENGDLSVLYHERDFTEQREKLPELYVLVEDPAGRQLYTSRNRVRFAAGRAEYFEIVLPEAERPPEA